MLSERLWFVLCAAESVSRRPKSTNYCGSSTWDSAEKTADWTYGGRSKHLKDCWKKTNTSTCGFFSYYSVTFIIGILLYIMQPIYYPFGEMKPVLFIYYSPILPSAPFPSYSLCCFLFPCPPFLPSPFPSLFPSFTPPSYSLTSLYLPPVFFYSYYLNLPPSPFSHIPPLSSIPVSPILFLGRCRCNYGHAVGFIAWFNDA